MKRREFIAGLGSAAAWPVAVRAQGERVRRVGVLMGGTENDHLSQANRVALWEGLAKLGWVEGRNLDVTGTTNFFYETGSKWLELLKQVAPRVERVAIIYSSKSAR